MQRTHCGGDEQANGGLTAVASEHLARETAIDGAKPGQDGRHRGETAKKPGRCALASTSTTLPRLMLMLACPGPTSEVMACTR